MMNRLLKYCILLMVAQFSYFTIKFIERHAEKIVKEETLGKCNPRRQRTAKCQPLFRGQPMLRIAEESDKECDLEELIKDCPKLRWEHGYEDKPVSEEELKFPLAFSIKMHRSPHQAERLLRTIYRPHNFYCIHVDLKADPKTYDLMKGVADCLKNVVLSERIDIVYNSYRFMQAEISLMKCCLESNVKWKYYINLTGQEFVLRTNLEIVEILKLYNGANDIESYAFKLMDRVNKYYKLIKGILRSEETKRGIFKNVTLRKGSAYGMFSRSFVDFVLTDSFATGFYEWLKNTKCPEETIWSTLNRLPFVPGGHRGFDVKHSDSTHASKIVLWLGEPVDCYADFVHCICIFTSGNLAWLRSRPEVSANKFYEELDPDVLDCLEGWVNNRTYSASLEELNWYYYRNLPQVKYSQNLKDSEKSIEFLKKQKEIWLKNSGS